MYQMPNRIKQVRDRPVIVDSGQSASAKALTGVGQASPCCKKCKLLADNTCGGCGRSLEEIATWAIMSPSQKQAVLNRLKEKSKVN